ncbi:HMA2 domain-containing protein [Breznakiella homolactica]|uniref:ATPase P n=1 Tax=Breznakiella homolactica TaxID=2798577 RepID=A0A7T7XM32_9SPIR|nr:ATPase P [Breznakiella homolactica]QQO08722.1 ATPase P [Breznakiella homolactica]
MVVSYSEGRIRLRFRELRNPLAAAAAEARIRAVQGVTKVAVKVLTGSILIEFDPEVLPLKKLIELGKKELGVLGLSIDIPGLPQD